MLFIFCIGAYVFSEQARTRKISLGCVLIPKKFKTVCEATLSFTKCGICVLMKELGLYDLTPALCHLDYTMSEAGGVTNFVRQYTLASGGPYCDCGYKKKG